MVLKEEPVGRVRVDLQPRLWDKTRYQVAVVRQDHGVTVAVRNEHRHLDRTESLQETVVWDPPRANGVILSQAGFPGRRPVSVLLPGRTCASTPLVPPACSQVIGQRTRPGSHRGSAQAAPRPR